MSHSFRLAQPVLLVSLALVGAAVSLPGCKSRPRGGVYMAHNREPPKFTQKQREDRALADLVMQPHIRDLRYQQYIRALFTRSGCDSGACHGAADRGGGLRFLDGSPRARQDYEAILQRLDRKNPEKSELVEKITNRVPHNGGRNIDPDSCDYKKLIAWIGEQPEPSCSVPPPPDDAERFAREAAPALLALGCADKTCHGGTSRGRFDLESLGSAVAPAPFVPAQIDKARREVARFDTGWYAAWNMAVMRAANAADGIHQRKADPLSCAYLRLYSYIGKSPEQTCELAAQPPVTLPSLEVFTRQVQPALGRRGCLQTACHGNGAGGMTLLLGAPGTPEALHSYLMLLGRVEDLGHIDDSTLLRTARNKEPHGGGPRLGGKGDCVDDQITAWLRSKPIQPCPPAVPPTFESFVDQIQPVLEKMTCTNPQCHGGLVPHFYLINKATLPEQLRINYKAVLKHIDYDYAPFSGVMLRMREPCAYSRLSAWIEKKTPPNCKLVDPDPRIFPRRDDQGNIMHPKVVPGPPPAAAKH